ncbi:MAG: TrbI/VirB10 family protein [Alphaproteobacteria bacterium]|nr:TrbI/VirB10 family protein [Alphaproteobacteria bacterium]
MSKLKEQFSELRKNTPKRVQWLLLAAAFVVVLILLTLLLSGGDKKTVTETDSVPVTLKITPDMVNWPDVVVGTQKTQKIKVSANAPAKIVKLERNIEVPGLRVETACPNVGAVSDKVACEITIKYSPSAVMQPEQVPVFIHWHAEDESETMLRKDTKIVLTLGAVAPKATEKPQPKVEKKPEPVTIPEPEPEPEPSPVVIKQEIKKEIETIAPAVSFDVPARPTAVADAPQEQSYEIPDGCSDFAFPGYNSSGTQIGWIKPQAGAYKFYPFSDKECKNPTGTYNPDNGIITDSKGKKIGTDADHIGYATIANGVLPELGNAPSKRTVNRATQLDSSDLDFAVPVTGGGAARLSGTDTGFNGIKKKEYEDVVYGTSGDASAVVASQPYDRSFVLRQYKPIPATIVSEVRADADVYENGKPLPVRATVDRNVYSDNGRNIIIPAGTLMLGYVSGDLPGPYKAIGRMQVKWYQFIRPDGVEFNFDGTNAPFAGDAQGRVGVPGRGSTDYMEQFIMPMLTAIVPAAVNLIAPVSDAFVNQIDLDNNTVVQSGTVRSSELAKNEIITAWNQVAQKLMVDMMDNTVPPFSIAAGTRITVYSPEDLIVVCPDTAKKCYVDLYLKRSLEEQKRFDYNNVANSVDIERTGSDWVGQVRSFNLEDFCSSYSEGKLTLSDSQYKEITDMGYSYSTVLAYCQASQYEAKNMAKQKAVYENQQDSSNKNSIANISQQGTKAYNEQVLGLTYDEETGAIQNPFNAPQEEIIEETIITCEDGNAPDANGCCAGEIYTDMGEQGFNCCPEAGGDCFPPIL